MLTARRLVIILAVVAVAGATAAVVLASSPGDVEPARTVVRPAGVPGDGNDASALLDATLRYGTPMREARADTIAAPRRAELERCADVFRAAPEYRKAELTRFYGVVVTESVFHAEASRLARWAKQPAPGTTPDDDIDGARDALREELVLLGRRYRTPIDGCATVRAWSAGGWGDDARPAALIAVTTSLAEEQQGANARRAALRAGAERVRDCAGPDAGRAANLLQAGVVIPSGVDESSPIIAAIDEDDAFSD